MVTQEVDCSQKSFMICLASVSFSSDTSSDVQKTINWAVASFELESNVEDVFYIY